MNIELTLQNEIEESKKSLDGPIDDTIYRRDLKKRIELINWVLENMKNPDMQICDRIESRMNQVTMTIKQTHTIFEADKLHSQLNILDWIFYVVCKAKSKRV